MSITTAPTAYCGHYPAADHTDCPSSIECHNATVEPTAPALYDALGVLFTGGHNDGHRFAQRIDLTYARAHGYDDLAGAARIVATMHAVPVEYVTIVALNPVEA